MRRVLWAALIASGTVLVISTILYGRSNTDRLDRSSVPASTAAGTFDPYPAPDVDARTMSGPAFSFAELRGKPVLVNFFADWCTPCDKEAPEISKLAARYGGDVVMVSVARESSRSGAEAFMRRHGMDWTVLWDGDDTLTKAFRLP